MSNSAQGPRRTPASGAGETASAEGLWGLDLWNGSAWFSDWFYTRLQWPPVKRKRLDDLQPYLPGGAWETLLVAIRCHMEQGTPLDVEIKVELPGGQIEWWQVQGTVERNVGGQPVYLAGRMRDATALRPSD
jgi:PAS domain-containing protein